MPPYRRAQGHWCLPRQRGTVPLPVQSLSGALLPDAGPSLGPMWLMPGSQWRSWASATDAGRAGVYHYLLDTMSPPPRSPWQRAYIERLVSIRRECLDHFIVLQRAHPETRSVQLSNWVRLFRYRKLVACTIATSAGSPENLKRPFQRDRMILELPFVDLLPTCTPRNCEQRFGTIADSNCWQKCTQNGLVGKSPPLRRAGALPHLNFR